MQAHTVERVESWDSRPFSGGFHELHDLADGEFSGVVVADDAWLFMLNGRVIGVFEGDIEDFGDVSGTVYEAPHPSLALLFSMQERGGETQAKYYTNDTPLSEAAQTLEDASFTGYIELSENVLSGDYYVVYYGGRSMSAAFVGASEELITGDEAFERADDEVGLYEVKKSPVNVTSLPAPEDDGDDEANAAAGAGAAGATAASAASDDEPAADEPEPEPQAEEREPAATDDEPASPSRDSGTTQSPPTDSRDATTEPEPSEPERSEHTADTADASTDTEASPEPRRDDSRTQPDTSQSRDDAAQSQSDAQARRDASAAESGAEAEAPQPGDEGVFDQEEEWRNAKSVPTLDPEKSESTDGGATTSKPSQSERSQSQPQSAKQSRQSSGNVSKGGSGGKRRSTVEKLKRAVKQRDAKLEEAAERIERLEGEREELRERVETLEAERDELRERADELEAELEAAEAAGGEEPSPEHDLTPAAALSDTNLFVRYGSKGKPTLDDLGPDTDLEAVNKNLRIDHHTQFEAADATVDGEDYETFLQSSASYRFVSWAVRELPFEIRDAGHADGLGELYDALPEVDRAELDGTVEIEGEDGATSRTFDVVLRDRMGEPLVVAELNAEREPVTGEEMDALVDAATVVREGVDELSAAMYVTASFFEPAALETANEETGGGGFLSRNDKESYVRVGRKSGYHLCLVEDRNDAFHLTVPEL